MAGLYLSQITRFTVSSSIISSRADGWIQSAREAIRSMHLEKGRQIAEKSIIQPPGNWVSTDSLRISDSFRTARQTLQLLLRQLILR
jgi:hypothetical protein